MIEAVEQIGASRRQYPNTRTTLETNSRINRKGLHYLDYQVGEPAELEREQYENLVSQAASYIKICERFCQLYYVDSDFKRLADVLVLQHESNPIKDLVKTYPISTLDGIRYATDTMIDLQGKFKTTEVNLGPAGGVSEGIQAQILLDRDFPIPPSKHIDLLVEGFDSYYRRFCKSVNIEPKSQEERKIAIVENDEWTPGNFLLLNFLREKGLKIEIVPKEELYYDESSNKLFMGTDKNKKSVDQLILYFHLQEDYLEGNQEKPGDIVRALQNKAVAVESSMLPLIILASKSIASLISNIANNPNGLLARKLGIDPQDLEIVKDIFPKSFYWRNKFFKDMEKQGFSRVDPISFFQEKGLVIKSSRTNLFAGMGVYGTENKKGRKNYFDLQENVIEEVYSFMMKNKGSNLLERHINTTFFEELGKFLISGNFRVDEKILTEMLNVTDIVKNFKFDDIQEIEVFFNNLAEILSTKLKRKVNKKYIINYLSTFLLLPYAIQEKIVPSAQNEIRTCGIVGEDSSKTTSLVSTLERAEGDKPRILRIIIPKH